MTIKQGSEDSFRSISAEMAKQLSRPQEQKKPEQPEQKHVERGKAIKVSSGQLMQILSRGGISLDELVDDHRLMTEEELSKLDKSHPFLRSAYLISYRSGEVQVLLCGCGMGGMKTRDGDSPNLKVIPRPVHEKPQRTATAQHEKTPAEKKRLLVSIRNSMGPKPIGVGLNTNTNIAAPKSQRPRVSSSPN